MSALRHEIWWLAASRCDYSPAAVAVKPFQSIEIAMRSIPDRPGEQRSQGLVPHFGTSIDIEFPWMAENGTSHRMRMRAYNSDARAWQTHTILAR